MTERVRPASAEYAFRPDYDTDLSSLAKRYGTTVGEIMALSMDRLTFVRAVNSQQFIDKVTDGVVIDIPLSAEDRAHEWEVWKLGLQNNFKTLDEVCAEAKKRSYGTVRVTPEELLKTPLNGDLRSKILDACPKTPNTSFNWPKALEKPGTLSLGRADKVYVPASKLSPGLPVNAAASKPGSPPTRATVTVDDKWLVDWVGKHVNPLADAVNWLEYANAKCNEMRDQATRELGVLRAVDGVLGLMLDRIADDAPATSKYGIARSNLRAVRARVQTLFQDASKYLSTNLPAFLESPFDELRTKWGKKVNELLHAREFLEGAHGLMRIQDVPITLSGKKKGAQGTRTTIQAHVSGLMRLALREMSDSYQDKKAHEIALGALRAIAGDSAPTTLVRCYSMADCAAIRPSGSAGVTPQDVIIAVAGRIELASPMLSIASLAVGDLPGPQALITSLIEIVASRKLLKLVTGKASNQELGKWLTWSFGLCAGVGKADRADFVEKMQSGLMTGEEVAEKLKATLFKGVASNFFMSLFAMVSVYNTYNGEPQSSALALQRYLDLGAGFISAHVGLLQTMEAIASDPATKAFLEESGPFLGGIVGVLGLVSSLLKFGDSAFGKQASVGKAAISAAQVAGNALMLWGMLMSTPGAQAIGAGILIVAALIEGWPAIKEFFQSDPKRLMVAYLKYFGDQERVDKDQKSYFLAVCAKVPALKTAYDDLMSYAKEIDYLGLEKLDVTRDVLKEMGFQPGEITMLATEKPVQVSGF